MICGTRRHGPEGQTANNDRLPRSESEWADVQLFGLVRQLRESFPIGRGELSVKRKMAK